MNRSIHILGFAFLALAVTMAAAITMRNAPSPARPDPQVTGTATKPRITPPTRRIPVGRASNGRLVSETGPRVSIPAQWVESLPQVQKEEWLARAEAVEKHANERLEQLTEELELSLFQRGKLFPALARSAPAYDPAMVISGDAGRGSSELTPAEELHALLESKQQEAVEDSEVNRQLWWQDILDKLEADLTSETGGGEATPAGPAIPDAVVPEGQREAPEARDDGNLFDLLKP